MLDVEKSRKRHMFPCLEWNAGQHKNMKVAAKFFKTAEIRIFGNDANKSKLHTSRNSEQITFEECLLLFGPQYCDFCFAL